MFVSNHFLSLKATGLFIIASFAMSSLHAQSQQDVKVVEYNGSKAQKPLANVGISVMNAPSITTDIKGSARLNFRTLHAGDPVKIRRMEFNGYEIFNQQAVDQWTISPTATFKVILCRTEEFNKLRNHYMNIASESYRSQYEKAKMILKHELDVNQIAEQQFKEQMASLESEYNQQLSQLENYVDIFARIDLSNLNSQQKKLVNLVKEGKFDEAILAYEKADYLGQFSRESADILRIDMAQSKLNDEKQKREAARTKIAEAIKRQVNTYQLAGGRENFLKASKLMKAVADADTTYVPALKDYYDYCSQQNNDEDIFSYGELLIRHSSINTKIRVYSALSGYCSFRHNITQSQQYLDQANKLIQQQLEAGDDSYEFKLTLLKYEAQQCQNADAHFNNEALAHHLSIAFPMVNELYEDAPEQLLSTWCLIHDFQALLLAKNDSTEKALQILDNVLNTLRPSLNKDELIDEQYIVTTSYKATIFRNLRRFEPAVLLDEEINAMLKRKMESNPDAFLFNYTASLCNTLANYNNCNLFDKALSIKQDFDEMYSKVTSIYGEIGALKFEQNYNYSILFHRTNNLEQAKHFANVAIDTYKSLLAPEEQDEYKDKLAELEEIME